MIHFLNKLPKKCYVACSGGVDSMVVLDFLIRGGRDITVAHFDHGTIFGGQARTFVQDFCYQNNIPYHTEEIESTLPEDGKSCEEHWRDERQSFFRSLPEPVITGHTLDDVLEWWLFSNLHGQSKLIPYQNENVIRPFLITARSEMTRWADSWGIPYMEDPSNHNEKYMRSIIRHKILVQALRVNPGLYKVLKKKVIAENE